jgi:hypothetical protein
MPPRPVDSNRGAQGLSSFHFQQLAIQLETEGPPIVFDGPPRASAIPVTYPPTCRFLGYFFLVRFWMFLGKGSSKPPPKMFLQKVHVENILQKKRVFPRFFCFIAWFGCF